MKSGMTLDDEIRYLKGVGPARAQRFAALSIHTVRDLLEHYPFRVDDYSKLRPIQEVVPGEDVTVTGRVVGVSRIQSMRGPAVRVEISDGTGVLYLVFYHMPYIASSFRRGSVVMASGKAAWRRESVEIAHPVWQIVPDKALSIRKGPVLPVYHLTQGLTSSTVRQAVKTALEKYGPLIKGVLPEEIRKKYNLMPEPDALFQIHFPESVETWQAARRTLAFREILLFQLALFLMRQGLKEDGAGPRFRTFTRAQEFLSRLPFSLTKAQERVIGEISRDLSGGKAMNRLLQGDVGSGKTVVAAYCLVAAAENGFQGAFLVPTEVLAQQHYRNLKRLLDGMATVELLTGSTKPKERCDILGRLERGEVNILLGTHALLEPGVRWKNLGLVVTDEQHRFGVRQRITIQEKAQLGQGDRDQDGGQNDGQCGSQGGGQGNRLIPHVLVMSATPIPRSLALTLYGDLDISIIDELPPGRKRVKTVALHPSERRRAYDEVRRRVGRGEQAYVVCPVIDEGESGRASAVKTWEELRKSYLRGLSVGLVHGDLSSREKESVMNDFVAGKIEVLVSTTVIEVGVDVPNATVMVIEDADSFGLATLHQLRGRVGRGAEESICFLVASPRSKRAYERLSVMCTTYDGLKLAELDLAERGPGQFFGTRQHGLPDINVADLGIDVELIARAREEAEALVDKLPEGGTDISGLLAEVKRKYGHVVLAGRSR